MSHHATSIQTVIDYVRGLAYQDVPPAIVQKAKDVILDEIGVILAASRYPAGKIATEIAREQGGSPQSSIMGADLKTSMVNAALANGIMAHAEDYDDVGLAIGGHPSVPMLPAVLALGEKCKASGKEVVEAYLVGFEVESRIGRGIMPSGHYQRGWHATATNGTLGAAAAGAKLLKLDVQQARMALAIAASQSSGLRQNFGTMTKPFHAGHAARSGVVAAMLASMGFTGHADIIEEKLGYCNVLKGDVAPCAVEKITEGLGETYEIITSGVIIKIYPSCGETHAPVDTLLKVMRKHNIAAKDIASIDCTVGELINTVAFYTEPKTGLEGKFSLEYCLARTALDGTLTLEDFTEKRVNEPRVQAFMKKVKRHIDPDPSMRGLLPAKIDIKLTDGRQVSELNTGQIKGYPEQPLTRDELAAKYKDCARIVLASKEVERSLEFIENLESMKDISELMSVISKKTAK